MGIVHIPSPISHLRSWRVRNRELMLDRALVMGILNTTPDSFSDGGRFFSPDAAVEHATRMLDDGADIIDVGGESTRPGAVAIAESEELDRVIPVIERIARARPDATISVDTVKSGVAGAALEAGAHVVNDVSGLRLDPAIGELCARHKAGLVLMHSRGSVDDMASFGHAEYADFESELIGELQESIRLAHKAGVGDGQIALDPGVGFA